MSRVLLVIYSFLCLVKTLFLHMFDLAEKSVHSCTAMLSPCLHGIVRNVNELKRLGVHTARRQKEAGYLGRADV